MLSKRILISLVLGTLFLCISCRRDDDGTIETIDEEEPIQMVPAAEGIVLYPTVVDGKSVFKLDFRAPSDESEILEYRVILVRADSTNRPGRAELLSTPVESYSIITKSEPSFRAVSITDEKKTFRRATLERGGQYMAYVLSIAKVNSALRSSVSEPTYPSHFGRPRLFVRYEGNMGISISDEDLNKVTIDAWHHYDSTRGYNPATGMDLYRLMHPGRDSIRFPIHLVLSSHSHADHHDGEWIARVLNLHESALFVGPPNSRSTIPEVDDKQISKTTPELFASETIIHNGIKVEVLNLRHFDLPGKDYSDVVNYGYIVHLQGQKIFHPGSALYNAENFAPFDLRSKEIDLMILPMLKPFLTLENKRLIEEYIAPEQIAIAHLHYDTQESDVLKIFPNARIFKNKKTTVAYY